LLNEAGQGDGKGNFDTRVAGLIATRWRNDTAADRGQQLERSQFKKIQMLVRVEMTLMLLAPSFATWMTHGEFRSGSRLIITGR
jgi:hypothetical protein